MRRVYAALTSVPLAGLVLLVSAPAADATFCVEGARERLASSDAAFVGRSVPRADGGYAFVVDQLLKGDLPAQVDVRDQIPNSDASLSWGLREHGPQLGVVLRREPDGGWSAWSCSVLDPTLLRTAAGSGRTTCDAPTALPLTVRTRRGSRTAQLSARVSGGEPGATARVDWGDGRTSTVLLNPSGTGRVTVRAGHGYRRFGTFRVRLVVSAPLPADCRGSLAPDRSGFLQSPRVSPERARTVRLRRG